jgi:hypothetical protein
MMKRSSRRNFLKKGAAANVAGGALLNAYAPGVMAGAQPLPPGQGRQAVTGAPDSLAVTIHTQQTLSRCLNTCLECSSSTVAP